MTIQLNSVFGIIFKPKQTIQNIPSNIILPSSLIVIFLLATTAIIQEFLTSKKDETSYFALAGEYALYIASIFLSAIFIQVILGLFRKRLTLPKVINILCLVQIPRLLFALPITIFYLLFPVLENNSSYNQTNNFIMLLVSIYSLLLLFYSLKISPVESH